MEKFIYMTSTCPVDMEWFWVTIDEKCSDWEFILKAETNVLANMKLSGMEHKVDLKKENDEGSTVIGLESEVKNSETVHDKNM